MRKHTRLMYNKFISKSADNTQMASTALQEVRSNVTAVRTCMAGDITTGTMTLRARDWAGKHDYSRA